MHEGRETRTTAFHTLSMEEWDLLLGLPGVPGVGPSELPTRGLARELIS